MSDIEVRRLDREDRGSLEAMRAKFRVGDVADLPVLSCHCGWFGLPKLEWFTYEGMLADGTRRRQLALVAYCHGAVGVKKDGKPRPSCGRKLRHVPVREPWTTYANPPPDASRLKKEGRVTILPYDHDTEVRRGEFRQFVLGDEDAAEMTAWHRAQSGKPGCKAEYVYPTTPRPLATGRTTERRLPSGLWVVEHQEGGSR